MYFFPGYVLHAIRALWRHPGPTAAVVVVLGVGVGVSAAVFDVVYGLLIRPLPYSDASRLVRIGVSRTGQSGTGALFRNQFDVLQETAESFARVAAYAPRTLAWVGPNGPEMLHGATVSPSLFPLLRARLHLGRPFVAAHGAYQVVLSHRTWLRRFAADPSIAGDVVELGGRPYTVAGVLSSGIDFPGSTTEFWIPMVLWSPGDDTGINRVKFPLTVLGRLEPGISTDQATAEVAAILVRGAGNRNPSDGQVRVTSLREELVGAYRPALLVLAAAGGVLLMLVGVGVIGLLRVRLLGRQRELAVRGMLGETSGRIVRGLLVESVVLSCAGSVIGVLVAAFVLRLGRALLPASVAFLVGGFGDGAVLAFTVGVSLGLGLLCGAVTALQWLRDPLVGTLHAMSRASAGFFNMNLAQSTLIVAQVALTLVLLCGAGLLMNSFARLLNVDAGHDARNILTARVGSPDLPDMYLGGITAEQMGERFTAKRGFYERLIEGLSRLEELPWVEAVGLSSTLPLAGSTRLVSLRVFGRSVPGDLLWARMTVAGPGYFKALRPRVYAGRGLVARDTLGSPGVAVVNETLARTVFGTLAVVGERITLGPDTVRPHTVEIVGVVADFGVPDREAQSIAEIYLSLLQPGPFGTPDEMFVSIRTAGDPRGVLPFLRGTLVEANPRAAPDNVLTMLERRSAVVAEPRFHAVSAGVISALALILATCSLHAVLSHAVWQRQREFGMRLALGGQRTDIFRLVFRQGGALVVAGIVLGLAASAAVTRLLERFLFGVTPMDLPTVTAVSMLVAGVALGACCFPAYRATRVEPMTALRSE